MFSALKTIFLILGRDLLPNGCQAVQGDLLATGDKFLNLFLFVLITAFISTSAILNGYVPGHIYDSRRGGRLFSLDPPLEKIFSLDPPPPLLKIFRPKNEKIWPKNGIFWKNFHKSAVKFQEIF